MITTYSTDKRDRIDINRAHDILNHMSEQVLKQTCKEYNKTLIGKLQACTGYLNAKAKRKKIMKATNKRATTASKTYLLTQVDRIHGV